METVKVNCWKCGGTGRYAIGTCFGCDGTGVNIYSAAAYARKMRAAKARQTATERRNQIARAAREAELASLDFAQMVEEVKEMCCVGHDGLVEDFGGERITVEEMAHRLIARQAA